MVHASRVPPRRLTSAVHCKPPRPSRSNAPARKTLQLCAPFLQCSNLHLCQVLDCQQRRPDERVVYDAQLVVQGDVQVCPHEHRLARELSRTQAPTGRLLEQPGTPCLAQALAAQTSAPSKLSRICKLLSFGGASAGV
jgi:hypothetical protein